MNKKVKIVLIVAAVIILAEVVLTGTLLVVKHNAENSYAQHLELAQKYLLDGDYEEAIAEFEAAIEIQPKQTDAYTGLADAYIAMGDYEAAVDILNEGYEATGERTVRRKLKSTQELMAEAMASAAEAASAAETVEAESTENAEQAAETEAVEAVSAEASSNEYYYAVATTLTKAAVEEYAGNVRNLFIQHKWSNLAGMIDFPITIDGITYDSIASFVQGGLDDIYSEDFMDALETEDCVDMYCTSDGIVLGNNNVVIAEVEKNGASALKIVGVNGLIDEEKNNADLKEALKAYYDYFLNYGGEIEVDVISPDYSLIYVDDDNIPEICASTDYAHGEEFLWVYNGDEVIEYSGFSDYIPKSGILSYNHGHMGEYGDKMLQLSNGNIETIAEGTWVVKSERYDEWEFGEDDYSTWDDDYFYNFTWNGESVTYEEYIANWDAIDDMYNITAAQWESLLYDNNNVIGDGSLEALLEYLSSYN